MHLIALHALESHPDIGLDVFHDMADVKRRIRVGQGGSDEKLAGRSDAHRVVHFGKGIQEQF
jgi:hypothetical protein